MAHHTRKGTCCLAASSKKNIPARRVLHNSGKDNVEEEDNDLNLNDSTDERHHSELVSCQQQVDGLNQQKDDTGYEQVSPQEDVKERQLFNWFLVGQIEANGELALAWSLVSTFGGIVDSGGGSVNKLFGECDW